MERTTKLKKRPAAKPSKSEAKLETARMPLSSRPGYLVRRLHQIHSAIFLEECQEFGITPVQYGLVTALLNNPGIDQVTLGGEVGIDRTNVADVLSRLSERGLVRRERSKTDRRSMVAFLTKEGEDIAERMYDSMRRAQDRFLAPLRPEFRSAFLARVTELIEGNSRYSLPEASNAATRRKGNSRDD
jgi:DNA-binding MarR family transcriptional regulator